MRQFHVGEVVTWIPDLLLRSETHGDYRIVAAMPDRDGDHMYRIKSPLEEYERVVKEGLLVKSNGYLPEETPARVSRHSSITLPTLQPGVGEALRASFPRSGVVAATVAAIACVAITRSVHSLCVGCGIEPPNDEIAGQEVRYPRPCRRREPDELNC